MSTVVFLHAHPDDEALLTGGTMAGLAARGHRVVLVTATSGEAGLTDPNSREDLGRRRERELREAAAVLGCARVELLGYPDSGSDAPPRPGSFAALPVDGPAARLAELLREENAQVLVGYDPAGGYGHPDHVQVHRVARAAAALIGDVRLLEATVDRRALQAALRLVAPLTRNRPDFRPDRFADRYSDPAAITHCVPVTAYLGRKRAAMRAHATQQTGDDSVRMMSWLLRLPRPLFRLAVGREWFVEVGAAAPRRRVKDLLHTTGR